MTLTDLYVDTNIIKDTTRIHVVKKRHNRVEAARSGKWYEDGILGFSESQILHMVYDGRRDSLSVEV